VLCKSSLLTLFDTATKAVASSYSGNTAHSFIRVVTDRDAPNGTILLMTFGSGWFFFLDATRWARAVPGERFSQNDTAAVLLCGARSNSHELCPCIFRRKSELKNRPGYFDEWCPGRMNRSRSKLERTIRPLATLTRLVT
jgi:hypothetical protein